MSGPHIWLCLFTFRPIALKEFNSLTMYNRYCQLTRWCSGNASALGALGPGFNYRLLQGFLCLIFGFVVFVLLLLSKNHIICHAEIQFLRKPTKAVRRLRTNLNILNNAQSELLGQFRLTGDRAKYSMYSILYIDDDVTMC